ncbi:hypothetical protein VN97_g8594, partial [Penicillium thymicola]
RTLATDLGNPLTPPPLFLTK